MSAELEFLVETRHRVTRVPLESIRWVGDQPFAALAVDTTSGPNWQWKLVALGATDTSFAEVVAGLEPGDRVIAHSERLPAIELGPRELDAPVHIALGPR